MNTKKYLGLVMAKTSSGTQTVTNGHVGWVVGTLSYDQVFQGWRAVKVSKIECRGLKYAYKSWQ